MPKPTTDPDYGAVHVRRLRAGLRKAADGRTNDLMLAAEAAIRFLNRRLTDAAKGGCHHCTDHAERGSPCWWCGLKVKRR